MSGDVIPGTGALMVVEVGTLRSRPTFNLPTVTATPDPQPNHVLVVVGTDSGVGRNGYVNLLGSTLRLMARAFAIIELSPTLGSAARAHKADGVAVERVSPLQPDWSLALIDRVDAHFDRIVVLSVPAIMWRAFAGVEEPLLRSIGHARPVGYAFVDPTGAAPWLPTHRAWLSRLELPTYEHRLVLRGTPLYPPAKPVIAAHHSTTSPHFYPQIADAVFGRIEPNGQPQSCISFHQAWSKATAGTRAMMFEPVKKAMRDIDELLVMASFQLEREAR